MNMKNSIWMADFCQDSNWVPLRYKAGVVTFMLQHTMLYIYKYIIIDASLDLVCKTCYVVRRTCLMQLTVMGSFSHMTVLLLTISQFKADSS
jgi:hypothetical protein